jgi:hypothetical protein
MTDLQMDISMRFNPASKVGMFRTSRPAWNARCKSGYQFNGRTCKRLTGRGMLLCNDCLSAEVLPAVPAVSIWNRMVNAIAAAF